MGKNVKKIQDMLTGNYGGKIQVGYGDQESKHHQVGDRWTDSDGVEWEQKNGFYTKVNSMPAVGIFSKQCKDCDKVITNSNNTHPMDFILWKKQQRCFHCQIDFEAMLKTKGRWRFWVRLQQLSNMEAIEKDLEASIFEKHEQDKQKIWDRTVANALANSEVDLTIGKNKNS